MWSEFCITKQINAHTFPFKLYLKEKNTERKGKHFLGYQSPHIWFTPISNHYRFSKHTRANYENKGMKLNWCFVDKISYMHIHTRLCNTCDWWFIWCFFSSEIRFKLNSVWEKYLFRQTFGLFMEIANSSMRGIPAKKIADMIGCRHLVIQFNAAWSMKIEYLCAFCNHLNKRKEKLRKDKRRVSVRESEREWAR